MGIPVMNLVVGVTALDGGVLPRVDKQSASDIAADDGCMVGVIIDTVFTGAVTGMQINILTFIYDLIIAVASEDSGTFGNVIYVIIAVACIDGGIGTGILNEIIAFCSIGFNK